MTPQFNDAATGSPVLATSTGPPVEALRGRFGDVRRRSHELCETLETEDFVVQSMPDVSPTKWHLAHTSWFFETFLLSERLPDYEPFDPHFRDLFNSYYNTVGKPYFRPHRGLVTRPTVAEVFAYRRHVDESMGRLFEEIPGDEFEELRPLVDVGLNHEEQHQELMLTDIKHVFATNPLLPIYRAERETSRVNRTKSVAWHAFGEEIRLIGWSETGFAFDNERPRHRELVPAFEIASRLVTNGDFLDFMMDGGYRRPELWLSDGWNFVRNERVKAPLYWREDGDRWLQMTLAGERPVRRREPVCHVSFYEADAYARWAGARLPTEAEWETVAAEAAVRGNFLESGHFHPAPLGAADAVTASANGRSAETGPDDVPEQLFGDVWEWTRSPYQSYPGYRLPEGALGEYNAKFMCNQMVLRGGSCVTPVSHIRPTYRNFFPPDARWQFTGFRLARDPGAVS